MSYSLFKQSSLRIKIFISKRGRLISDILELSDILEALAIEKAFYSIDHLILLNKKILRKEICLLDKNIVKKSRVLYYCIVNGGTTAKYFKSTRFNI